MAAPQPDPFRRVSERFALAAKLEGAAMMLNWDSQTHMPGGGAWARGEEMAAIAEVRAGLMGSEEAAGELAEAEAMVPALEADERADLSEMRRLARHAAAVPKDLVAAKARLSQTLQAIWPRARAENDFAAFAGPFEELLGLIRQIGQAKSEALGLSPYGALIDEYDPGVSEALIDPIFADLAAFLPPLIAKVRERQGRWKKPLPIPAVEVSLQAKLAHEIALAVGHREGHFRVDQAPHPFSVPHSPGDVRFTTRYDIANPKFAVFATLHEAGHSMYEFNLPRRLAFRPTGQARGASFHESQSLSLERYAGRSAEFLSWLAPQMARIFGGEAEVWSGRNVRNAWRRLDPGFIRTEADEVSYPLHVILRYRLEQAMMKGDLKVRDLPEAWNEGFEQLLGLTPPDFNRGCLQDIHWAMGLFGYFANYAIGAVIAGQLFEAALKEKGDILQGLSRGDFRPYFAWVKPHVHERASLVPFAALIEEASGAPLSAEPLKRHLARRHLEEAEPA